MIKVIKLKKLRGGKKKYEITFEKNGKKYIRKFGSQGMSDYTIHKDKERRERYISRHKKDLRTNDPMKPGYLSMYILWNKPSLKSSLADYKRRLGVYNRTKKFPKAISGSKKLSFGTREILYQDTREIPYQDTSLSSLPTEALFIIEDYVKANNTVKKRIELIKKSLIVSLLRHIDYEHIRGTARANINKDAAMRTMNVSAALSNDPNVYTQQAEANESFYRNRDLLDVYVSNRENIRKRLTEPYLALVPVDEFSSRWLSSVSRFIPAGDFDFENENFWWKVIEYQLSQLSTVRDNTAPIGAELSYFPSQFFRSSSASGLRINTQWLDAMIKILNKTGYPGPQISRQDPKWGSNNALKRWARDALVWWQTPRQNLTNFGAKKKKGSKIPDNVVNKKLYASVKAKIRRSVKGRRWGAYDSGRLVREYKAKGGRYSGKKGKTNLGRWYREKWVDACSWPRRKSCGSKTKKKVTYCRPSKKIDSKTPKLVQKLTKAQIKSRCKNKKKSPMKRVTKFGQPNQALINKMRKDMYNQIISSGETLKGMELAIKKRCSKGFQHSFCQNIFNQLLLSIYFSMINQPGGRSAMYKQNINDMKKFIPKNFKATKLVIRKYHIGKIQELTYYLQDHTYGTFYNARLASLLYEYIRIYLKSEKKPTRRM